ncbi:MAG: Ribosome maturation factor RimM [Candidatus Tokpelaia hoelldobleri]|uniref:Ribosome maturation factor RimM n=1 Tax=Candidatus Tokpelaia hoelldobleri TaxID=1902579 RepID=A0A1U9JSB0_9HYPH|nr:MAG: Ribosome maturation factor RimM [Candidatus Tokpelaia hoelldoblerii]
MTQLQKPVLLAVIGSAHGTGGEVRIKSFTGDPLALKHYGTLYDKAGRSYRIKSLRPGKTVVIARLEGVDSRNAAEALKGTELFVDRSQLPENLEEDEFYQDDLIGFIVVDETGEEIGRVKAFFNFGGGDIVEITMSGRKNQFIPFSRAAVPQVDIAGKRIVVDRLAAGLAGDETKPDMEGKDHEV